MRRRRQSGFALLLIFAMMSAAAVMVYMQLPRFVMQSQRAKEQLLIDRGEQYQRAIQLYYRKLKTWPQSLDDLEKGNNMRFLRRKYKDPFTGKAEWRIVHMANGVYTDSLVYNNDPNKQNKEKAQVFVAEQASIGTDTNSDQAQDGKNLALQARPSDKTNNPLDDLPASLRAFVYPGSIAPRDQQKARNPDDDVQYADGAKAPTAGVFGVGAVPMNGGYTPPPPDPATSGQGAPPSVQPGAGGLTFDEIQRRAAEAAANNAGLIGQVPGGGNNSLFGQPGAEASAPSPVPGALGLAYSAISNPNAAPVATLNGAPPPLPGTIAPGGFPGTGVQPQPFGNTGNTGNTASAFIGGNPTYNPNQPAPGFGAAATGFGGNGLSGYGSSASGAPVFPGAGATPGVGATSPAAAQMLNNLLTQPRQVNGAQPAGSAAGGSGIVGVASKYRGDAVKTYREKAKFQLWEFIYDPAKDKSGQKPGQNATGAPPLPGGLPPGTATQPGVPLPRSVGPTELSPITPGQRAPSPNSGFGPTTSTGSGTSGFGGSSSFIGGTAAPVGSTGAPLTSPNGTTTPRPTTPNGSQPPPTKAPGSFIGGP